MMLIHSKPHQGAEGSSRPDIENWWAAEAMIASYNHVYHVTYNTKYQKLGPIGVSIYEDAPVADFQYEFLALSDDTGAVLEAIHAYPIPQERQYVINVFHSQPSSLAVKTKYLGAGFEFIRTGPIFGVRLSKNSSMPPADIHKATTIHQAVTGSLSLAVEGERIHSPTLADRHIHSFYALIEGEAVGWLQLVTLYPGVGYIHQLYVLEAYRGRRLGTALVQRAHIQAKELGLKHTVLVPSEMAMPLYRRLGYHPLLYFSAFRPVRHEKED